jgi:hypothetical protein
MAIDKVVLALQAALRSKYGNAGMARIDEALRMLAAADRRRGLVTEVIHLDDAGEMSPYGGATPAVADARAVKEATDRIARAVQPHDIVLIGGPDVMPMVPVVNPAYSGVDGDGDRHHVLSDLPHVCDAPNFFLLDALDDESGA